MNKLIGTMLYALLVVGVLVTMPAPAAKACEYRCGLDFCRGGTRQGYIRRVQFNNYAILLENELCTNGSGVGIYLDCQEYPCGSVSAGTLFHIEGSQVYVFKPRNQQEGEEIIASISKGLRNAVSKYGGISMPSEQFEAYHLTLDQIRKAN